MKPAVLLTALIAAAYVPTAPAQDAAVRLSAHPHWLELAGRPTLLIGDSVTQGWMESGENFDQKAYVDALARRGINALLLWSYIAIIDQRADERVGYDAPEIWPWRRVGERFDLSRFNDVYFDRLRELIGYAGSKGVAVIITVHDGWPKTKFAGHPFNAVNGGPLETREQYVELHKPGREMPASFDNRWSRPQKHQYYLERFSERLIAAAAGRPNVLFEIFNEGEWYNQESLAAFQAHFLGYFRKRTPHLLLVNSDHVRGSDFRSEPAVDIISLHKPRWDQLPGPEVFFSHFAAEFAKRPVRPVLFSEPVPEYVGEPGKETGIMRLLWGTALGGAGVVFQNDTSWAFDPRSAMASRRAERDRVLDLEGHLARFVNAVVGNLPALRPDGGLSSTGFCLANADSEYVVYALQGTGTFTVDLPAGAAGRFSGAWYDPSTGKQTPATVPSGGPSTSFASPFEGDAVLHLKRTK